MHDQFITPSVTEQRAFELTRMRLQFNAALRRVLNEQAAECFVPVSHSHDYPQLLKLWIELSDFDALKKEQLVSEMLAHEYLHQIPALGQELLGLHIQLGVRIVSRGPKQVDLYPTVTWQLTRNINTLSRQGFDLAVMILELMVNPVVVLPSQELSSDDRKQIALFIRQMSVFPNLTGPIQNIIERLPAYEQLQISNLL